MSEEKELMCPILAIVFALLTSTKRENFLFYCERKKCAWWNADFEKCSIALLANLSRLQNKEDLKNGKK